MPTPNRLPARSARLAGAAAALGFGLALAACGGTSTDTAGTDAAPAGTSAPTTATPGTGMPTTTAPMAGAATAPTAPGSVDVKLFQFTPSPATVRVGETVTFTNGDDTTHTATAGTPGTPDGTFDLRLAGKGATATFTPTAPGTYTYYCAIHESMRGELVVTG